ncbi:MULTISPECIES: hypothetical protein [unclassified Bradyrhizobium]|uniref:hypothetical protein n=1 Tax=unclassified Bradyrhizobium TaxID=2631580 RepID=UPI001FFB3A1A|nr:MULTISPECIES: hypothetical protein [unclassified Bradyrhizobium]MCK1711296.1 hypothetical protein [Bradyrhizobium sp. 143]MCK1727717.1 hypothetical protein [Bradyrhizobium sp. 142]
MDAANEIVGANMEATRRVPDLEVIRSGAKAKMVLQANRWEISDDDRAAIERDFEDNSIKFVSGENT